MTNIITGIVAVHFDEQGEISYRVYGDESIRLFIVDDRAPHDRVYEWTQRDPKENFRDLVPDGAVIGSSQDIRHPAITAAVEAILNNKPRFQLVDGRRVPDFEEPRP